MILRPMTPADQELLEYWDEQPHVLVSDPEDEDWEYELPRKLPWREWFIAELNGEPIGCIQIIDPAEEETHYWGDVPANLRAIDIWIGEEYNLNKGYGTTMMNMAIEKCFAPPEVTAILIDPLKTNTKAHRFYKRLGFEFVEERLFNEDLCYVFELKRERWRNTL